MKSLDDRLSRAFDAMLNYGVMWRLMDAFGQKNQLCSEVAHTEYNLVDDAIASLHICGIFDAEDEEAHYSRTTGYRLFSEFLRKHVGSFIPTVRVYLGFNYDNPGLIIIDNGVVEYYPDRELPESDGSLRDYCTMVLRMPVADISAAEDLGWESVSVC